MPLLILLAFLAAPLAAQPLEGTRPIPVDVSTTAELEAVFQRHGYRWPLSPGGAVPPLEVRRLPRDLPEVRDVARRKGVFVRIVLPLALLENQRLLEQRRLARLFLRYPPERLGPAYRDWLLRLMDEYGVPKGDFARRGEALLRRLDAVPVPLVVAQAAMESGWGTSRFALEGNALFGQWTWDGDGLRPSDAHPDATHKVRAFPDLRASVRAYLHNLNTGFAYREFRDLRARLRAEGRPLDAVLLARGLERYSARGMAYVAELQRMLRRPELAVLEQVSLLPAAPAAPTPG